MDRKSLLDIDFDLLAGRISEASSGELALLYCRLLWPAFQEIEGVVLLEGAIESDDDRDRLLGSLARHRGSTIEVQKEWNFHEVSSLFGGLVGVSDGDYKKLVQRVSEMWQARLVDQFPSKVFVVEVVRAAPSDGHDSGVLFYERASA